MCAIDDGERFDVAHSERRKARKSHQCDECMRKIAKGEHYECLHALYDGRWMRTRTCDHCIAARSWLTVECDGYLSQGVSEELSDHWHQGAEYHSVWLARAIIGMRRQWKRKDGSLLDVLAPYERREEGAR